MELSTLQICIAIVGLPILAIFFAGFFDTIDYSKQKAYSEENNPTENEPIDNNKNIISENSEDFSIKINDIKNEYEQKISKYKEIISTLKTNFNITIKNHEKEIESKNKTHEKDIKIKNNEIKLLKSEINNLKESLEKEQISNNERLKTEKDEREKELETKLNELQNSIRYKATYAKSIDFSIESKKRYISNLDSHIDAKANTVQQKIETLMLLQNSLCTEKTEGFPWVANAYADFKQAEVTYIENILRLKKNPSIKAADTLKEYKQKLKEAEKRSFIYKGIIDYYETLFPWLTDFRDAPDEVIKQTSDLPANDKIEDPAQKLLSQAEWSSLSKTEKFQIALDRYKARRKSKWEIGREFERFVGYEYEQAGWDVTFFGAVKGLEDMGRDLILKRGGTVKIVQCKYWAKDKVIHEKHIFQLFGTCVLYSIDNNLINDYALLGRSRVVPGVFVTSCSLSETAKTAAAFLGIQVIEHKKMEDFPCIKCNIGRTGDKIFHLPFDLNYDKIKIEPGKGEFYCASIREAEAAGFRRAYRWHGKKEGPRA